MMRTYMIEGAPLHRVVFLSDGVSSEPAMQGARESNTAPAHMRVGHTIFAFAMTSSHDEAAVAAAVSATAAAAAEMEKPSQLAMHSPPSFKNVVTLAGERKLIKQEFEQQKQTVLASIPSNHQSLWGHVGFARTVLENDWVPCLFLGPYNVGPTSAMRQLYLDMLVSIARVRYI